MLSSPGKMIVEQYRITLIAHAEATRHKNRLVDVHGKEPANKKGQLNAF